MKVIRSTQNKKIKIWSRLTHKSARKKAQAYLIESWHLVGSAIATHQPILAVLVTQKQLQLHDQALAGLNVILITERVARRLAPTVHPQGIFAVLRLPSQSAIQPTQVQHGAWLLLDQVQDPGNIGTMVRTADAAGFKGVVLGAGTASAYNPKVIRAMQGSQFHLRVLSGNLKFWIRDLIQNHLPVYGTVLDPQAVDYRKVRPANDFALVMGNEGNGMQKPLLQLTSRNLYIPIPGRAESLNVAVAAGILMFKLKSVTQ